MLAILHTVQILGATEEAGGIEALGISPVAIVAQAATFILLFIIARPALRKIVATLENRRKTINQGIDLGIEMKKEQAELEVRIAEMLKKARVEGDRIIASGHTEASQIIKEAELAASAKVAQMQQDAAAHLQDEVAKARKALQADIVGLVAEATEALVGEKLDRAKDIALIEKSLKGNK